MVEQIRGKRRKYGSRAGFTPCGTSVVILERIASQLEETLPCAMVLRTSHCLAAYRGKGGSTACHLAGFSQHRVAAGMLSSSRGKSSWLGHGSQQDLMRTDECIVVSEDDAVLGGASKLTAHQFNASQPSGILHRAFSVFLFNSKRELLLQQRAASKITFPSVWTNTCCSHPLHGQSPSEVDSDEDVAAGIVPAIKHAAVRKLEHELGIRPEALPPSSFRYLTRLHYCAADQDAEGEPTGWGEHEMDYILFAQADVALEPNPEEVSATQYVTEEHLRKLMQPGSGLEWSPWFRIIARNLLNKWWADLDTTLSSDRFLNARTIHRLQAD